jgi:hypothetical protein
VHIMTVVEWASKDVVARVTAAVSQQYREQGYDPREGLRRLGITASDDYYVPLST